MHRIVFRRSPRHPPFDVASNLVGPYLEGCAMHLCKNPGDEPPSIDTDSGDGWQPKDGDKGGEKRWWKR